MKTASKGFSLIEIMVTMAIVALLASIVIPKYNDYIQRGDRSEGISAMQAILEAQERYYADNVTYTTDLKNLGYSASTFTTENSRYVISAQACQDSGGANIALTQCIELLATAQAGQADDGNLIVNTAGRQDRILTDGTTSHW